jgi:hypothetical protein
MADKNPAPPKKVLDDQEDWPALLPSSRAQSDIADGGPPVLRRSDKPGGPPVFQRPD